MAAEQMTDENRNSPRPFSVCWGWCLWLSCLTLIVAARQFVRWSDSGGDQASSSRPQFVVDLNTAPLRELQALPEVGPALATRIANYRQTHGPFTTVDQLTDVPGVGPRTLELLRPMLTVVPQARTAAPP